MKRILLVLLVLAACAFALRGTMLPPVARFLDVSGDCPFPVQYVVPLPGDDNTRTLAAAALLRHEYAERVAVLQGVPSLMETDGLLPSGSEITRRVLLARGIDEDEIVLLPGESASSFTDAQLLSQLWKESPDARVAIVSNGYHLRRVRWSVRRALPEHASLVSYIAAPIDGYGEDDWWHSEAGVSAVLSEYGKLAFYILKYGSASQRFLLVGLPLIAFLTVVGGAIGLRGRARHTANGP